MAGPMGGEAADRPAGSCRGRERGIPGGGAVDVRRPSGGGRRARVRAREEVARTGVGRAYGIGPRSRGVARTLRVLLPVFVALLGCTPAGPRPGGAPWTAPEREPEAIEPETTSPIPRSTPEPSSPAPADSPTVARPDRPSEIPGGASTRMPVAARTAPTPEPRPQPRAPSPASPSADDAAGPRDRTATARTATPAPATASTATAPPRPDSADARTTALLAEMPAVEREFRGVWIATVTNLDWPSRRDLTAEEQRAELVALLDRAAALGFNAVIFQVRPAAEVFYESPYEPWSEYLTGAMGRAPDPPYDPLAFAIEEAHARGLELHAWFNPFRVRLNTATSPAAPGHISVTRPELVRRYAGHLWLDPGDPAAHDYVMAVILDVVRRYDVDGVHLDDYFYPYPEFDARRRPVEFPDDATYAAYVRAGGRLDRANWRRANVDAFVERLGREIRREKPHVRLGISPFGIWRPDHPPGTRGFDPYAYLYADSRRWLAEGWVDYLAPQLYWQTGSPGQDFATLLRWWAEQNERGRHLWPGIIPRRVGPRSAGGQGWRTGEILEQIRLARLQAGVSGTIQFSIGPLAENRDGLADGLARGPYRTPALVPPTPWLADGPPPGEPMVIVRGGDAGRTLVLEPMPGPPPFLWLVRTRRAGEWSIRILPGRVREHRLNGAEARAEAIVVSAVDRLGREGSPTALWLEESGRPSK